MICTEWDQSQLCQDLINGVPCLKEPRGPNHDTAGEKTKFVKRCAHPSTEKEMMYAAVLTYRCYNIIEGWPLCTCTVYTAC